MKVIVDQDRCVGSGQCVLVAADVFDQRDEDGTAMLLDDNPHADRLADVRFAAAGCPALVIATGGRPRRLPGDDVARVHTVRTLDVVVVAVGSIPTTEWLAGSSLSARDGVECDAMCRRPQVRRRVRREGNRGRGARLELPARTPRVPPTGCRPRSLAGRTAPRGMAGVVTDSPRPTTTVRHHPSPR